MLVARAIVSGEQKARDKVDAILIDFMVRSVNFVIQSGPE
jgi:hypothetical protein